MKSFKYFLLLLTLAFVSVGTVGCGPKAVEDDSEPLGGMSDEEYEAQMQQGMEEAKQQGDGTGYN